MSDEFDVALSFAGEDRAIVAELAALLKGRDIAVFYDAFLQAELWGVDLYDRLDHVYRESARFTIIFVSEYYARKSWTNHERQSAQAKALESHSEYILPIRLDDSVLPGLRPTISYLDARHLTPTQIADIVEQKLGRINAPRAEPQPWTVPRSADDVVALLAQRPRGWEYLLFAGTLFARRSERQSIYLDMVVGYSAHPCKHIEASELPSFLNERMAEALGLMEIFNSIFRSDIQESAFGKEGQDGDADRIVHYGRRAWSLFEDFVQWRADVRATTSMDADLREIVRRLAAVMDQPIDAMWSFFDEYIAMADTISERLRQANGEPVKLQLGITLTIPDEVRNSLSQAIDRWNPRL